VADRARAVVVVGYTCVTAGAAGVSRLADVSARLNRVPQARAGRNGPNLIGNSCMWPFTTRT
jgi:multisubunit Na+/H+ antiporter MnhG subunit